MKNKKIRFILQIFEENDPTSLLYPSPHSWKTGWEFIVDLEIRRNTLFLLHVLKDLGGLLFYMLCSVFRRIILKIFVTSYKLQVKTN